jgi:integrase
MPKQKFKQGVGAVPGNPGVWDINYQIDGKRVTKRISACDRNAAIAERSARIQALEHSKKSAGKGDPIVDLNEALAKITERIKNEIISEERCKTSLSSVVPPYRRFFFDYPKSIGKTWTTTADFTPDDLEDYKDYYSKISENPKGVSAEICKIQNILTHFYKLRLISALKLFEFRQVRRPPKNVRPYIGNPQSDFIKVLLWIKKRKPKLFEFLCFVTNTGRRPKEIRRYLREYVNLDQDYIQVPASITKNKKASYLLLDDALKKDVIRAVNLSRKLDSKYLFLNDNGHPFSANNPQLNFQLAAKECGMPNWEKWCVYQLKKRFITICRSQRLSGEAISQVSGHTDIEAVIKNYSFPDQKQSEEVLKAGRLMD